MIPTISLHCIVIVIAVVWTLFHVYIVIVIVLGVSRPLVCAASSCWTQIFSKLDYQMYILSEIIWNKTNTDFINNHLRL